MRNKNDEKIGDKLSTTKSAIKTVDKKSAISEEKKQSIFTFLPEKGEANLLNNRLTFC